MSSAPVWDALQASDENHRMTPIQRTGGPQSVGPSDASRPTRGGSAGRGGEALDDERVDTGEVGPHVSPAVDGERRVPAEPPDEGFDEPFGGQHVDQAEGDPRAEPLRKH